MKELLKLIEETSAHAAQEISDDLDSRVWCWLHNRQREYFLRNNARLLCVKSLGIDIPDICPELSRSRDALKTLRPEGVFGIYQILAKHSWFVATLAIKQPDETFQYFESPRLLSEELAELHVIIQAIGFQRGEAI